MEESSHLSFENISTIDKGWHIVESDITYISQHKMVSYENKQTPFLKIEKKKQKTVEKEKAREREREGE